MDNLFLVSRISLIFPFIVYGVGTPPIHVTLASVHTHMVNTTLGTLNINPAYGICSDVHGKCSLRAAIMQSNYVAWADTIILTAERYQLTFPRHDTVGLAGSLVISDDLAIQAAGSGVTIIDRNGAAIGYRIFHQTN
jgi:hypothetical protein